MRVRNKGAKPPEPSCSTLDFCVEQVWPVDMDADTIFVHTIIDVSADVIPLINHMDAVSRFRQSACVDCTGKARSNYENASIFLVSI